MNHRILIEGEVRPSASHKRYSVLVDGVRIYLPWKLFAYMYKFARPLINIGQSHWVSKCDLEPARPENATGYIYNLKKIINCPGLIENDRNGYYGINPGWDVDITERARKLIEEG